MTDLNNSPLSRPFIKEGQGDLFLRQIIMLKDYYIVLGISRDSDQDRIKKAYRAIARESHPDMNQSLESGKRFMEVSEAYETLGNEAKRRAYDQELKKQDDIICVSTAPEDIQRDNPSCHLSNSRCFMKLFLDRIILLCYS